VSSPLAGGVTTDTARYYERAGLLPPPRRTPAGYRAYDVDAVDRLRFIQGAQRLGLRLRDVVDLLAVRDTGACPCEPAELFGGHGPLLRHRNTAPPRPRKPEAATSATT
jgi:DNA-binding transcriptional MerR regulator